jgi:hypothetical protein
VEPAPADPLRWHASPSLLSLRAEVDARWPNRDKSSDGTIGDYAHSTSMSEHNPVGHRFGPQHGTVGAVHAIDITAKGIDVRQVLDAVIGDKRVWYVIHAGSIWSKTYNWAQRDYNGSNPHDTHIHVSLAAEGPVPVAGGCRGSSARAGGRRRDPRGVRRVAAAGRRSDRRLTCPC